MNTEVLRSRDAWVLRGGLALATLSLVVGGIPFVASILSAATFGIAIGMLGQLSDDLPALGGVAVGLAASAGAILWFEHRRLGLWPYPSMQVVATSKFAAAGAVMGSAMIVPVFFS